MRKLYTIRDIKIGYGCKEQDSAMPCVIDLPNDEVAIRMVKGSVAPGMKPNILNINAEDKELWCVGEFDQLTGKIKACEPYLVARSIDYMVSGGIVHDQPRKDA